jgi:hypothetical protein
VPRLGAAKITRLRGGLQGCLAGADRDRGW